MADKWTVEWIATHPVTVVSVLLAGLGGWFHLPVLGPLWTVLWHNAGALLALTTVSATQIAPRIEWLQPYVPVLQVAVLVSAVLFAATKIASLGRAAIRRYRETPDT